jgi:hypothetical protein
MSSVRLSVGSRSCAPLRLWGSEWHVQTSNGMATDGGPSYESLVWPANDGISLTVTAYPSGCNIWLSQALRKLVSIPVSPALPHAPAMPGKRPTAAVNQDLALIKRLISEALKRKGVAAPRRANNEETGACNLRLQPDEPAVFVDVWL